MSINVTPIPRLTNFGAPSFTLGTSNAAGDSDIAVASNSTLLTYDTTVPEPVGTAAAGDTATAARRNHVHAAGSTLTSGSVKVWSFMSATGANTASYNVTSTVRNSSGNFTITIATDFDSGNYAAVTTPISADAHRIACVGSIAAGTLGVQTYLDDSADSCATGTIMCGDQ